MCNFKSALIARYQDSIKLFWRFDEDFHHVLLSQLIKQSGVPEEVCPIEIIKGEIFIDLPEASLRSWMLEYINKHRKLILRVEQKALKWMQTNKMRTLIVRKTANFVIPRGSRIERIYAHECTGFTAEEPIIADYVNVSESLDTIIPANSKIETLVADGTINLRLGANSKIACFFNGEAIGTQIPKNCKITERY